MKTTMDYDMKAGKSICLRCKHRTNNKYGVKDCTINEHINCWAVSDCSKFERRENPEPARPVLTGVWL